MTPLLHAVADGYVVARRNTLKTRRVPEILIGALIQPLLMIFVFGFVFGNAIDIPGGDYREFLIGGVFGLTVTFGAAITAAGLADDLQRGIMDRFRSLPMSGAAVVLGRTASDLILTSTSLLVMAVAGAAVGWRIPNGIGGGLAGFGLLLFYAYSLSWIMAYVGMVVRSVEVVNNAALIVIFPMTFAANTLVPSESLPGWLQPVAEWNPVSAVTQAARELFGNIPDAAPEPTSWPLQHPVLYAVGWGLAVMAVFGPLSVRRFRTR